VASRRLLRESTRPTTQSRPCNYCITRWSDVLLPAGVFARRWRLEGHLSVLLRLSPLHGFVAPNSRLVNGLAHVAWLFHV